jgi:hypothetical protein
MAHAKAYAGPSAYCKRACLRSVLHIRRVIRVRNVRGFRWIFYVLHVPGWCASALRGRL